jgi:1-acyl-sn-glycerol-3-phosphate acyltransferase
LLVQHALDLHVTGLEHVPEHGAVILVARHFHHLYDAAAILASVPREVHILIGADWLAGGWQLAMMRRLAGAARWPMVWRRGSGWRFNRDGYRLSLALLGEGRLLLIFPEGYPTIDPRRTTKIASDAILPFDPGCIVLAERIRGEVPLVPVGLCYTRRTDGRWHVCLRFGAPLTVTRRGRSARQAVLTSLECAVRKLSVAPC